jgi:hypothetical protein
MLENREKNHDQTEKFFVYKKLRIMLFYRLLRSLFLLINQVFGKFSKKEMEKDLKFVINMV